jgi:sugar O-acyltransferase (sialic acid O-acetyltransferase NeuD family)
MNRNSKDIYIVGAGGFGREVLCLLNRINRVSDSVHWYVKGFVDQSEHATVSGIPVITDEQLLDMDISVSVALAVGQPTVRSRILHKYAGFDHLSFPNLVDPDTLIMDLDGVSFGQGNIVCAGTIFTTSIKVGSFNVFNLSCTVGHDVMIGDNNIINPSVNVSGEVCIGDNCLIGTGAQILQQLTIGDGAVVGAGAVVVRDVEQSSTVVGVPAKKIK